MSVTGVGVSVFEARGPHQIRHDGYGHSAAVSDPPTVERDLRERDAASCMYAHCGPIAYARLFFECS